MKITKFVHSCLLVEEGDQRILVDPGSYSWQSGLVGEECLKNISSVVVTHIHPDHLSEDFAKAILLNSPDALWYGTQQVVHQLQTWGISAQKESADPSIIFVASAHAELSPWFLEQPEHTSFVVLHDVLVTGDCHTLTDMHGARVLAGAVNGGPWGAPVGFAKMVEQMENKPETIIPLHDWHWNDQARAAMYERFAEFSSRMNTKFVPLENGVSVDI